MNRNERTTLLCVTLLAVALGVAVAQRIYFRLHPPLKLLAFTPKQVIGSTQDYKGEAKSPYTLVEFGDYQCVPCSEQESRITSMLSRHRGRIKLAFRNYPLEFHPFAISASLAAESARQQGKFWPLHDSLYALKGHIDKTAIEAAVRQAGVDKTQRYHNSSSVASGVIQQDQADVHMLHVRGTPAFFLCGADNSVWQVDDLNQVQEYLDRLK